ncbi:MAG: cryptochrome/photolyase family protein [Crocinitomicaceae bacterium]
MSEKQKEIGVLFPHQLFEEIPFIDKVEEIILIEEFLFFRQYKFHKQKIAFHRSSMKSFEQSLKDKKVHVKYIESHDDKSDVRALIKTLRDGASVHYFELADDWLKKRLHQDSEQLNFNEYPSPLFINKLEDLSHFFKADKRNFFQTTFYKQERKKLDVLMDGTDPEGGQWTFDADNRKKYPKNQTPPSIQFQDDNPFWLEAVEYVEEFFSDNPGELQKQTYLPVNHADSNRWLQQFFEQRFYGFGDYEDAIVKSESFLHHSLLSPLINVGLLEPLAVVKSSIEFATSNNIPINSLEGFVRQIIGWREFIRGMYHIKGNEMRTTNFWGFKRKIPTSFYDGTTGIEPVDDCIKKVLKNAYNHHIERLMVIGNFMLLCEFDPDDVYQWFMELYIDAFDWVMVPNVYGMSQFADGGLFATKPYISSSNYVLKMSDYKKGEWQKVWDGLFWRFMLAHREFFQNNPRLAMLTRNLDRMSTDKMDAHLSHAQNFLDQLDDSSSSI